METWTLDRVAQDNWNKYHLLIDQVNNQGTQTQWSRDTFLALPPTKTQQYLSQKYNDAQFTLLYAVSPPRDRIRLLSMSGSSAAAI